MTETKLGLLTSTDPSKVLAKAAEKLSMDIPCKTRQCHMRGLSTCQNEPHCSAAGECVLFLAIGLRVGAYVLRHVDSGLIEIMNDGEGGHFRLDELAELIGRFVGARL